MSSITDLNTGDIPGILVTIVIGGFAFYFATVLSEAVTITINSIIPDTNQEVIIAWINFLVALIIVGISVYIIVRWFKTKDPSSEVIIA